MFLIRKVQLVFLCFLNNNTRRDHLVFKKNKLYYRSHIFLLTPSHEIDNDKTVTAKADTNKADIDKTDGIIRQTR